jgi:RND family efflux transporter MFP subunit
MYAFVALLAVAFIGAGAYSSFRPATRVDKTTVVAHYPADDLVQLSGSGYAVPYRKASLSSKITGRLVWLGVREGTAVRRDQLLARLDDAEYRAGVDQADANLDLLQSRLAQAQAAATEAELSHQRAVELRQSGFIAESALDTARAKARMAGAAVAASEAEIRVARALLHNTRIALEQTRILAPFDGVVIAVNANVGDIVTPFSASLETKGAVLTVADPSSLEIRLEVAESQLARLAIGQPCLVRLDAQPDLRRTGSVTRVVPVVDRAKGTVPVLVRVDAVAGLQLLPDMSAKVDLLQRAPTVGELQPVTAVDETALTAGTGSGRQVLRIVDGRARVTPVETGKRYGRLIEIVTGLVPGDQVVLRPSAAIADRSAVRTEP